MSEFNNNLWAPWRSAYISSLQSDGGCGDCFLCVYGQAGAQDVENHVICRSSRLFLVLNRYPYANGHLMIAPLRHVGTLEELDDEELLQLGQLTRDSVKMLKSAVSAQGFNVGINLGRCAGAGLPGHVHVHVVPRWNGDTNFMFSIGAARVIPQSLEQVYTKLAAAAGELGWA